MDEVENVEATVKELEKFDIACESIRVDTFTGKNDIL